MPSGEWYYARGNQQHGPVSATELKALAESGALSPDDLVWRAGMSDWVAARRIKGLFDSPAAGSVSAARTAVPQSSVGLGGGTPGQGATAAGAPAHQSPPVTSPPAGESAGLSASTAPAVVKPAGGPTGPGLSAVPPPAPPSGLEVASAQRGAPAGGLPQRASATFERSSAAFERSRLGEHPHLFDYLLDALGAAFSGGFTEGTARLFALVGHYGLYAAIVLVLLVHAIAAVQAKLLVALGWGLACVLALALLQYAGGRFANALNRLDQSTSAQMVSTAVTDCFALFALLAGLACLIGSTVAAVVFHSYGWILSGVATFVVCQYAAMVALNPEGLGLSVSPETTPSEEAIGLLTFVAKLGIRLIPAVIAAGVACGTLMLCYALYLAAVPAAPQTSANPDTASSPDRSNTSLDDWLGSLGALGGGGGRSRDDLEVLAALTQQLGSSSRAQSSLRPIGPLVVASSAEAVLLWSAAFPLLAYLGFLAAYVLADMLRILIRAARTVDDRKAEEKSQA